MNLGGGRPWLQHPFPVKISNYDPGNILPFQSDDQSPGDNGSSAAWVGEEVNNLGKEIGTQLN